MSENDDKLFVVFGLGIMGLIAFIAVLLYCYNLIALKSQERLRLIELSLPIQPSPTNLYSTNTIIERTK